MPRARIEVLLVCSSTSTHATEDSDLLARDLRKLAMLALPLGIKVAYEGLSWGRTTSEFTTAWEIVCRADVPNLGIGIDSYHVLATESSLDDLDMLDPQRIFLVQLADFMWQEVRTVLKWGLRGWVNFCNRNRSSAGRYACRALSCAQWQNRSKC